MTLRTTLLATALTLGVAAPAAMATTLTTNRAAFLAGAGGAVTSTPNPGDFDLSGLFLPTTSSIPLADGLTLSLSNAAQVTQPQNGFPYLLSDGFSGELFLPLDSLGNQVSTETIAVGGISALGFEVAPFSSASPAPYVNFPGGPFTVTVSLQGGPSSTVTLPGGDFNTGSTTPQFFGFYGGGVSSLTISSSDPDGLAFGNFLEVQVPEPASGALLLAGVTALIGLGRRRSDVG